MRPPAGADGAERTVDNLLDEHHEDAIGSASPGFRMRLLVSQSF